MNEPLPPLSVRFDLATVPDSGTEKRLTPSAEKRAEIAAWAEINALHGLEATIRLNRFGPDTYSYDAHFEADVEQACVVTLEPVRSHIVRDIQRRFRIRAIPRKRKPDHVEILSGPDLSGHEDDEIELLSGSAIDLAAPVLEEFSLSLDPYPRASGADFAASPETAPPKENPFAVLEQLKSPGPKRR